ncbi:right-handed parallel beta-helix repeat-containing protein [uncultured Clostridium sp.]|uniref:right-handed parallel beta-helix repeat-containing protein n=1 Tax=uncultured Clostridium sp. TaxID=59620 RepID=UPI0028EA668A|nr:right-handed parallel beta-helix repeat-containing protein [uncultured Clostridium sp.]
MNKKIIKIICWVALFLIINQWYGLTNTYAYTIDSSWVIIDTNVLGTNYLNNYINNQISNSGGNIKFYIKDGTYNLSGSIIIDEPNVVIHGESNTNTKLIQTNSSTNTIKITQGNVNISNLYIDGSNGYAAVNASNHQYVHDVSLEDCIIYGSSLNSAILFSGDNTNISMDNSIQRNEIHAPTGSIAGSDKDGIALYYQENAIIKDNTLIGSRIGLNVCEDSKVLNNIIEDSVSGGIRATIPAQNNDISYNTIKNIKDSGITVVKENSGDSNDIRADGITITNNTIDNSQYFGIEVRNLESAIISDNKISNIYYEGIYLLYSDKLSVENNTILNCGLTSSDNPWNSSLSSGIFLDTGVKDSNIESNTIHNDSLCPYGIRIQPIADDHSGNTNNLNSGNYITDNIVNGNFEEGISVNKASNENTTVVTAIPEVTVSVTDNSVKLNWNEISGVTDYEVEVCGNSDWNGSTILLTNDTTFEDSGLPDNSIRYYRVRMEYGNWSNEITAITSEAPQNLLASPTQNSINLIWDPVPGAEEYEVEADGNIINNSGSTSYTHTGLASSSTHKYRVRVKTKNGVTINGPWSTISISTLPATVTTSQQISSSDENNSTTTPPAVLPPHNGGGTTTPSDGNNSGKPRNNNSSTHHHRKIEKQSVEISLEDYKNLYYKENLINDYDENKLKRMLIYTFNRQYWLRIKVYKDNQVISEYDFNIMSIPENLFTESDINHIALDKNDNIDTILVKDFLDINKVNKKDDGFTQYSIVDESNLSIDNSEIKLQKNYKQLKIINLISRK